ncbi:hypothetical protein C8R47DRAFT_1218696 [Mycena vitilis]|nr:hypothetical protein C8R47DRAFT_1218696 [Mycena vitilis]
MTHIEFLHLPAELILACLADLPLDDLDSCLKCGNRTLHEVIDNSVLLRYRRAQDRAGVEENPCVASNLGISDRLAALHSREANWSQLTPRSRHTIAGDLRTGGLYDLASDTYFVGNVADPNTMSRTGIKYVCTSPMVEPSQWRMIDVGRSIIDFGTALEEHDMIAMVTYTPFGSNASIDVQLLNLSTGAPHSLAAHPTLHIHDVEQTRGRPGISIEIVGNNLALSLVYWDDELGDMDTFHLYNWKSGAARMDTLAIYSTGLMFLATDIIVIPNTVEATLDVLRIPEDEAEVPQFLRTFYLPTLIAGNAIVSMQCRGVPNPRLSTKRPSRAPFLSRPADSILLFFLAILNPSVVNNLFLVLDRARFLALVDIPSEVDNLDVPWEEWGPPCARWLDATDISMQYITTTAGQRMVTIPRDAPLSPAPIRLLDFNPANVEAQRKRGVSHGVRVVGESTLDLAPFTEPVVSCLPYVEVTSEEQFDYAAVMINDENIIGARFADRSLSSLEVLHFG